VTLEGLVGGYRAGKGVVRGRQAAVPAPCSRVGGDEAVGVEDPRARGAAAGTAPEGPPPPEPGVPSRP
jgi:hypothetical protein